MRDSGLEEFISTRVESEFAVEARRVRLRVQRHFGHASVVRQLVQRIGPGHESNAEAGLHE